MKDMIIDLCPICSRKLHTSPRESNRDIYKIECSTCGKYSLSLRAQSVFTSTFDENKKYTLSGITRDNTEHGIEIELLIESLYNILASASIPDGPLEAMDRILLYVARHAETTASYVEIKPIDYPIAYAKGTDEFAFYLSNLIESGFLNRGDSPTKYRLSIKGWERLRELKDSQKDSSQAFVAMWFTDETKDAWLNGFEPALRQTAYIPIRIDLVEHNKKIDDQIIAEIRRSGLLIADFTGNRGGVYFEAGFAMGLGIPVIWTCREDHVEKLHFDTRQYNHIVWKTPEELKAKLIYRIEATLPKRKKRRFV